MLECSLKGVLREGFLRKFISDRHWDSLNLPPVSHTWWDITICSSIHVLTEKSKVEQSADSSVCVYWLQMQDGFETWNEKKSMIVEWLGLGSTVLLQRETENANRNEGKAETMRGYDNWHLFCALKSMLTVLQQWIISTAQNVFL